MHIRIKSIQCAERRIRRVSKTNACISAIQIGSRARGAVSGLKFSALACGPRGTLRRAAQREGVDTTVDHGPRTMHTRIFFFEFTQTGSDETVNIYLISGETFQKSR